VHHQCGVDALERPALDHLDLAPASLLGGRAQQEDPPAQLVGQRRRGEARAEAGGRDDVVPAGVPDAGERVVLAEDGDGWAFAGLDGGAEGGLHAAHALLDLEALLAEELREPGTGLDLLIRELRIVVDVRGRAADPPACRPSIRRALAASRSIRSG
jgi:hypothetical protein